MNKKVNLYFTRILLHFSLLFIIYFIISYYAYGRLIVRILNICSDNFPQYFDILKSKIFSLPTKLERVYISIAIWLVFMVVKFILSRINSSEKMIEGKKE